MIFNNLETSRLTLKNIGTEDRDFIFGLFSNGDVTRYLYDAKPLTDVSGADDIINLFLEPEPRNQHRWIIIRKSDNAKMGTCGFHRFDKNDLSAEMGYDLHKEFWGNGYMQEAISAIIKFAEQTMAVKTINAHVYIDNIKSICLMDKLGFRVSDTKNYVFRNDEYPHKVYTLNLSE